MLHIDAVNVGRQLGNMSCVRTCVKYLTTYVRTTVYPGPYCGGPLLRSGNSAISRTLALGVHPPGPATATGTYLGTCTCKQLNLFFIDVPHPKAMSQPCKGSLHVGRVGLTRPSPHPKAMSQPCKGPYKQGELG